jgi:hypothetical protein
MVNEHTHTQEVLGGATSLTFLTLFNNKISVALFNYDELCTLVSMVTLLTMTTVIKHWVQLWEPLLHKYDLKCHTIMA